MTKLNLCVIGLHRVGISIGMALAKNSRDVHAVGFDPEKKIVAQMFINQFPNSHEEIHNKFKVQVYSSLKD